jgi:shikimate kinase
MFYLIGGAPRAGKTTIAKRLSEELGISWISTDTIESVVCLYVQEERFAELFPKTVVRRKTNQSNDIMYGEYTDREIIDLYKKQAKTVWKAIETFIECESKYSHDYVLEGHHLHPELVLELQGTYPLRSVFIGRENVNETLEAILKGSGDHDWVIAKTTKQETFSKIAKMLSLFSTDFRIEAEKLNLRYLDMGNDLNTGINGAVRYLKSSE